MRFLIQNKKIIIPFVVFFIIFAYHILGGSSVIEIAKKPILNIGSRFYYIGNSLNNVWFGITKGPELSKKISQLEQKLSKCAYYEYTEQPLGNFLEINGADIIKSKIVMMPIFGNKRTLLIDKGSNDGIFEGAAVMTPEGIFVGKIISVKNRSSIVSLVTDSSSTIAVSLANNKEIQAIAQGKGGVNLKADLIPQNIEISKGDIIITSLLEENTPQGLLVGTITKIYYTEGELFKQADLAPFLSLSYLKNIGVVVPRR